MTEWQPIETAPRDGTRFLAGQGGEVYEARYDDNKSPRLCFRTHSLFTEEKHRIISAVMDGREVKAKVETDTPWKETFRHDWTYWTRGFDFKPTHWMPLPESPK